MLECVAYVSNQQHIHLCFNFGVGIHHATTQCDRCDSNTSRRPSCFHTYCLLLRTKVDTHRLRNLAAISQPQIAWFIYTFRLILIC